VPTILVSLGRSDEADSLEEPGGEPVVPDDSVGKRAAPDSRSLGRQPQSYPGRPSDSVDLSPLAFYAVVE
jgi:hypothetical protein